MEKLSHHSELEHSPEARYSKPLTDILKDPAAAAELWPDYAERITPQIEQRLEIASSVNQYLDNFYNDEPATAEVMQDYWQATSELLRDPDYERIALFLPFESFPDAEDHSNEAKDFRESYLEAWQNLLFVRDVRENFNEGDVLEVDARTEDPPRVVKAAHLTPFLIQKGLITTNDISGIMESGTDDLLCRSFLDTLPMMQDLGQVSPEEASRLERLQNSLPDAPAPLAPKYISKNREAWLAEKTQPITRPIDFTDAMLSLGEPLSSRISILGNEIQAAEENAAKLDPEQTSGVVLLGGSRLKGYGRADSDLDFYTITNNTNLHIDGITTIPREEFYKNPSSVAHEMFNTLMIGDPERIQKLQQELAPVYFCEDDRQTRKWSTERLEQDLLEYRLLQKGYARLCPDTNPEYKKYTQMDGQSAFYETGFRVIATKIYANSIFIPRA